MGDHAPRNAGKPPKRSRTRALTGMLLLALAAVVALPPPPSHALLRGTIQKVTKPVTQTLETTTTLLDATTGLLGRSWSGGDWAGRSWSGRSWSGTS